MDHGQLLVAGEWTGQLPTEDERFLFGELERIRFGIFHQVDFLFPLSASGRNIINTTNPSNATDGQLNRSLEHVWANFAQMRFATLLHFVGILHTEEVHLEQERKRQHLVHFAHLSARF